MLNSSQPNSKFNNLYASVSSLAPQSSANNDGDESNSSLQNSNPYSNSLDDNSSSFPPNESQQNSQLNTDAANATTDEGENLSPTDAFMQQISKVVVPFAQVSKSYPQFATQAQQIMESIKDYIVQIIQSGATGQQQQSEQSMQNVAGLGGVNGTNPINQSNSSMMSSSSAPPNSQQSSMM